MNKVILMGRLTRDVEMRQTPNGVSLARFSIAVNRRFAGKDAQQQADFINCVAWRQTGEFIARYFQKGSMIAVVGSIQSRSWDGNDGKKQYATEVVVDEAYFTGSRAESGTQGGGNYQNQGFNQGGFNAPQSQPAQGSEPNFGDDFDMGDFSDLDGSEDDLISLPILLVLVSYIAHEIPIDESFSLEVSTPANASLTSVHAIITLSPIFLSV